jgi:hypothetical protein
MALEQNAGTAIGDSTPVARGVLPPLSDHACFIFVPIRISPRAKLAEATNNSTARSNASRFFFGPVPKAPADCCGLFLRGLTPTLAGTLSAKSSIRCSCNPAHLAPRR